MNIHLNHSFWDHWTFCIYINAHFNHITYKRRTEKLTKNLIGG